MAKFRFIKTECPDCGGTGLYRGMCEAPDGAVVCLGCAGTGCSIIRYKPFHRRKKIMKNQPKAVWLSRGRLMLMADGQQPKKGTYADFLNGKIKY